MGGPLDIEQKGYESDTMLDPLCQLELWLNYDLIVNIWIFTVKVLILWNGWTDWYGKRDINRWTLPMTLTLDFENNSIWEITSDITLVYGKHFHHSFVILSGGRRHRGKVRNVGVFAVRSPSLPSHIMIWEDNDGGHIK